MISIHPKLFPVQGSSFTNCEQNIQNLTLTTCTGLQYDNFWFAF